MTTQAALANTRARHEHYVPPSSRGDTSSEYAFGIETISNQVVDDNIAALYATLSNEIRPASSSDSSEVSIEEASAPDTPQAWKAGSPNGAPYSVPKNTDGSIDWGSHLAATKPAQAPVGEKAKVKKIKSLASKFRGSKKKDTAAPLSPRSENAVLLSSARVASWENIAHANERNYTRAAQTFSAMLDFAPREYELRILESDHNAIKSNVTRLQQSRTLISSKKLRQMHQEYIVIKIFCQSFSAELSPPLVLTPAQISALIEKVEPAFDLLQNAHIEALHGDSDMRRLYKTVHAPMLWGNLIHKIQVEAARIFLPELASSKKMMSEMVSQLTEEVQDSPAAAKSLYRSSIKSKIYRRMARLFAAEFSEELNTRINSTLTKERIAAFAKMEAATPTGIGGVVIKSPDQTHPVMSDEWNQFMMDTLDATIPVIRQIESFPPQMSTMLKELFAQLDRLDKTAIGKDEAKRVLVQQFFQQMMAGLTTYASGNLNVNAAASKIFTVMSTTLAQLVFLRDRPNSGLPEPLARHALTYVDDFRQMIEKIVQTTAGPATSDWLAGNADFNS